MKIVRLSEPLTQVCTVCGRDLPLDQFYDKDESGRTFSMCIEDYLAGKRERYSETHPPQERIKPTEKTCSACGTILPVEQFGWKDKKAGRRREHCPPCHREATRKYKAENRAKVRAGNAQYRQENKPVLAERQRNWRTEHPDRSKEITAKSKQKHKDRVRTDTQRRRDGLRGRGGRISAGELRAMFARYGWRCIRCGELKPLAFDHVDPNGPGSVPNGQPLCTSCNSWKLARTDVDGKPIDFRPGSPYDTRPDLSVGTVDITMGDLPVPEWVHHPRRQLAAAQTERLCLGPTHGPDGQMLPIDAFPLRSLKSGKPHRKSCCQPCLNELLRQARAKGTIS